LGMHRPVWFKVSLARKVSLLFGTAVLLTIIATLSFPWLHMQALSQQSKLLQAKLVAHASRQAVELAGPDWIATQQQLDREWPVLARELGLPCDSPRLVSANPTIATASLVGDRGFRSAAIAQLQANPHQSYYWDPDQKEGKLFRLAMAIRHTDTDPHPQVLRGIIDVKLPVQREWEVWNLVITLLAGASGAVLAILVFYLVTQRLVLSKVNALREVAQQVTTGDIEVRASISSGDEFQQLSDAFNDMLTHLKSAQDDLQTINRSLDIKLGELAEANVMLFESNRVKSDFLSNVTHELRTPLVSIIGFAELLHDAWKNTEPDRNRLERFASNILTSGRSLLEIINDLLDLAKIEAGKMDLHLSEFGIEELCTDLIDFVRPLADKRNQTANLHLSENLPTFNNDSGKIKQILYNLLSNAIKFTPTGGSISLSVEPDEGSMVKMTVRDTGPGIPEDQREGIFEKFHQLDSSRTREYEGTGLGLAITKELVAMLGGNIKVEEPTGEGAVFVVCLPPTAKRTTYTPRIRLS